MTEAEWLTCEDPQAMLAFMRRDVSDRKLRLYFCESAWHVRHLLTDTRSWQAVEVAERYADGSALLAELEAAHTAACLAARSQTGLLGMTDDQVTLAIAAWHVALAAQSEINDDWTLSRKQLESEVANVRRCNWIRDIFGNPFRPVRFSSSWRTDTVVTLAKQMYDQRDFSAMPILADALQDAGCDNDDVLTHCRDSKQAHVRGCWVVDLVLGKS
jgi:hypothetical protein